jgi:hypothetical protein
LNSDEGRPRSEESEGLSPVNVVRAGVHGDHQVALNMEHDPQVGLDFHGVKGPAIVG